MLFIGRHLASPGAGRRLSTTQLASADARAVLAIAPGPAEGLTVAAATVPAALCRARRQLRSATVAASIMAALRIPQLRQELVMEQVMRADTLALLGVLDAACDSVGQLTAALNRAFRQHPDDQIITSIPGPADISGAIVLAEIGDD